MEKTTFNIRVVVCIAKLKTLYTFNGCKIKQNKRNILGYFVDKLG